ncbi:hypothetical protein MTO96_039827 [Rhipicephalus appendiculatus]
MYRILHLITGARNLSIEFSQHGLYPIWDESIIVINSEGPKRGSQAHDTQNNKPCISRPDKTAPLQSYLKPNEKNGQGRRQNYEPYLNGLHSGTHGL